MHLISRIPVSLLAAAGLVAVLAACSPADTQTQAQTNGETTTLSAVATVGMIGDVVANIGGERVTVTTLMGPGVDPHLYRATAQDIQTLQDADIIFRGGLLLEGRMGEIFDRLGETMPVITMTGDIPEDRLLMLDEATDYPDPHVWFDVSLWSIGAQTVADALTELDPANAQTYAANAAAYIQTLTALDSYVAEAVATIPEAQRLMVTAHDAFNYFGRRYNIEVTGLQGISTEAEAGVQDVQNLVSLIVEREIPAIFVESSVPARTLQAVQEAAAARGWQVTIPAELFSDAMGDAGTNEGTYVGMVIHNVAAITSALGGELPPLPEALSQYEDVIGRATQPRQ
jgi:manganese/zinc/iron transport system substrate-binding protein